MGHEADLDTLRNGLSYIENAAGKLRSLLPLTESIAAGNACSGFFSAYFREHHARRRSLGGVGNTLQIFEENGYSVALGIEVGGRSRPSEVSSVPQDMIFALLSDCSVHIEVFRSSDEAQDVPMENSVVAHHCTRVLRRGQALFIDGARDHVLTWSDTPYVSLVVTRQTMVRHLALRHDSITGTPLYATAASQHLSRLQHACNYMAHFGDAEMVPPLQELTRHPAHFIRWKAAEALLNLDFDAGRRIVDKLRSDPHPHIADAARLAWTQLQHANIACH